MLIIYDNFPFLKYSEKNLTNSRILCDLLDEN